MKKAMCALLAMLMVLALPACGKNKLPDTPSPKEEIPTNAISNTVFQEFFYVDASGYIVPVARRVRQDEDATALMRRIMNTDANKSFFADTGLSSAVPDDFDITCTVEGGLATVNLVGNRVALSAAQEKALVRAVVASARQLPGVTGVKLTFDGQALDTLTHKTAVSGTFKAVDVNVDLSVYGDIDKGSRVMLYFTNGEMLVPVSRYLENPPTLQVALSQLCDGPSKASKLKSALPAGTIVRFAQVENGVATIDFNKAFEGLMQQSDGGAEGIRAVLMTCSQFDNVQTLRIQVEGTDLDATDWNLSTATFANEF
nr:GerMN domain-containing protein [bacterium]